MDRTIGGGYLGAHTHKSLIPVNVSEPQVFESSVPEQIPCSRVIKVYGRKNPLVLVFT